MRKAILTYLHCFLLVIQLHGIKPLIWRYDLYQRNGTYADIGILVGVIRGNRTLIVKDSEHFKRHLELGEAGYDLDKHDIYKLKLWPRGIIPYFIDAISYDRDYRNNLRRMLNEINDLSGIHFIELSRPPTDDSARYVYFINRIGSSCTQSAGLTSTQFTNHGVQRVVLGYNSLSNGDMYGFVLAVAGIAPQNNAPNRNRFITVRKENVLPDKKHLFDVLSDVHWLYHDLAYDYGSASHFRYHEYTKNGFATIKPKLDVPEAMGQGFTFYDVLKMRRTYNYISDKIFIKVPDPAKLSYMYMTTGAPGQKTTNFPEGMSFGNPDNPNKKEGNYDDYKHTNKPIKSTTKDPRQKHHKYIGDKTESSMEHDDHEVHYDMFKAKQDEEDEDNNNRKKGIPRAKPNRYLGLPGDDPEPDEEKYRPQHAEQAEGLMSEEIELYFSESREMGTDLHVKRKKHKGANKHRKARKNGVYFNI